MEWSSGSNNPEDIKIERDTTLNFNAFSYTYNAKGEKCLNEAGFCSVYLYEIYFYLAQDPKKVLFLKKPLIVYNAGNMFKGFVFIEIDANMISAVSPPHSSPSKQSTISISEEIESDSSEEEEEEEEEILIADSIDNYEKTLNNTTTTTTTTTTTINKENSETITEKLASSPPLTREQIFKAASEYDYMGDNKKIFEEVFKLYILATYSVFDDSNSQPTWVSCLQPTHTYTNFGVVGKMLCITPGTFGALGVNTNFCLQSKAKIL
jgi:hypothetical protein